MITPKVHITLPDYDEDERDEERHFAPILPLLEGLIKVNEWHLRRSLRRAQKGLGRPIPPLYASGVRYKEDPPGQENWKDIPAVLKDGHGDCLPVGALVLRSTGSWYTGELVPLLALRVGDRIMGDGRWTTVLEACVTGGKRIVAARLDNGCELRCSREHKVFRVVDDQYQEVRASEVTRGDMLASPAEVQADLSVGEVEASTTVHVLRATANLRRGRRGAEPRVVEVGDGGYDLCADVTTDTGKFWLPESDVVVHNCDRLVAWRVAELRVAGHPAEPVIKWKQVPKDVMVKLGHPSHMVPEDGISMVHVCVGMPGWRQYSHLYEQNPLVEDPSKLLGMGGSFTSRI